MDHEILHDLAGDKGLELNLSLFITNPKLLIIYELPNFNDELMREIKQNYKMASLHDWLAKVRETGEPVYCSILEKSLDNLQMIDSRLPEMLAYLLLYHYDTGITSVSELTEMLTEHNPLNIHNTKVYGLKMRTLLATAVKESARHFYLKNQELRSAVNVDYLTCPREFEDYVIENSFLDILKPPTIYKEHGKYYFQGQLKIKLKKTIMA